MTKGSNGALAFAGFLAVAALADPASAFPRISAGTPDVLELAGQGPHKREGWTYKRNEHGDRYPYRFREYQYYYGGFYYMRPWWYLPNPFWIAPRYDGPVVYDYGGWYRGYYDGNGYGGGTGQGFSNAHVDWCLNRYRSYNVETDTFRGYDGLDHRCVSPF